MSRAVVSPCECSSQPLRSGLLVLASAALSACGGTTAPPAPFIPSTQVIATQTERPEYPIEAACAGIGGTTVAVVTVGVEGKPTDVTLRDSSGNKALDDSALARIPEWRFKPATRAGKPVPMSIQVPVNFKPPSERPAQCFQLDEKR